MADPTADQDSLTRFLIAGAGVRGVRVHLDQAWAQIRERADDASDQAPPVAAIELLGEATVAAALFTAHAKIEGRLSVQLRGDGALRTLFCGMHGCRHAPRDRAAHRRRHIRVA